MNVAFIDLEVSKNIDLIGCVYRDKELKTKSVDELKSFLFENKIKYICGHNFIGFDREKLKETTLFSYLKNFKYIDTLFLSMLLFPEKNSHKLEKNYKEKNAKNDPLLDSKISKKVFEKEIEIFKNLNEDIKSCYFSILKNTKLFKGFFYFYQENIKELKYLNFDKLIEKILSFTNFDREKVKKYIKTNPIEFSFSMVFVLNLNQFSIPPFLLFNYPSISKILKDLTFEFDSLILEEIATREFDFESFKFREYEKPNDILNDNMKISQKEIIKETLKDKSLIAILPTGGGKTLTFQLPAIIKANATKALSVIISPLQSLMKDQIENFNKRVQNYKAGVLSSFLSPIERAKTIEEIQSGEIDLLYIAPETLRSESIFNLLKNRLIDRFIIDEAHCLSTWGQDFRQDYYYIAQFIDELIKAKPYQDFIPISCFSATAKPEVIIDIKNYFKDYLKIELVEFIASSERFNLEYNAYFLENQKDKYNKLVDILQSKNRLPAVIYNPTSTKECNEIAERLSLDTTLKVFPFHSKVENKEEILDGFLKNKIDVIVATTAFGMGVDKDNIKSIIHYQVSENIENYLQESGRALRKSTGKSKSELKDEDIGNCTILFSDGDIDKHFKMLKLNMINHNEINSIYQALKRLAKDTHDNSINKSILEITKEAGFNIDDVLQNMDVYENKIKSIFLELERKNLIKRGRNKTNFHADSINVKDMEEAKEKIENSKYDDKLKQNMILIMQNIIKKSKTQTSLDELSILLEIPISDVARAITKLREEQLLIGKDRDLTLRVNKNRESIENVLEYEDKLANYLLSFNQDILNITTYNIQQKLNIQKETIEDIIRFWNSKRNREFILIKKVIKNRWKIKIINRKLLIKSVELKSLLAKELFFYLKNFNEEFLKINSTEMKKELNKTLNKKFSLEKYDKVLYYLHFMKFITLIDGVFIYYTRVNIVLIQNIRSYTIDFFGEKLQKYYTMKIEAIHFINEFVSKLIKKIKDFKNFMNDYFTFDAKSFKDRYFKNNQKILSLSLTQSKFDKIILNSTKEQKEIIESKANAILILAGPGSGKTQTLVNKIAYTLLTDKDVKPEQFLMLTYSKVAVLEFKSRLKSLIGDLIHKIDIATFHSFALNLTGQIWQEERNIIEIATQKLLNNEVNLTSKTFLIIDEYQDINKIAFKFIKAFNQKQEEIGNKLKIVAVGDDDQCILSFEGVGASVEFFDTFWQEFQNKNRNSEKKELNLTYNFRSDKKIVEFSNSFAKDITKRVKTQNLVANSKKDGNIEFLKFNSEYLYVPILNLVKEIRDSEIAILTDTNEEVLTLYSLLRENEIEAEFMVDRENFQLKNLIEIEEFNKILTIDNEIDFYENFQSSLKIIKDKFQKSKNLTILDRVVKKFLFLGDYKISSWFEYLEEISLDDFNNFKSKVIVSTIHKAKGKEFASVILMQQNKRDIDDYVKRVHYVAFSRAKHNLYIYTNQNYFDKYFNKIRVDNFNYEKPSTIIYLMGLRDLYLDYSSFGDIENYILNLNAGEEVEVNIKDDNIYISKQNFKIAKFSKTYKNKFLKFINRGYIVESICIDFIVNYFLLKKETTYPQLLCKIKFSSSNNL